VRRQNLHQFAELLVGDKTPTAWRLLLEPNDWDVLNLPVFVGDAKHAQQAGKAAVDDGISRAFGLSLLHKFAGRIDGNVYNRRSRIGLAETEKVVQLLQPDDCFLAIRARRQGAVPAFNV